MRKVLIWILPLFALAWSCAKDDAGTAERAKARLTLNILEEGPRLAARAADEKAVQDVNVFLYDVRGIARPQHFYVQGGVLGVFRPRRGIRGVCRGQPARRYGRDGPRGAAGL